AKIAYCEPTTIVLHAQQFTSLTMKAPSFWARMLAAIKSAALTVQGALDFVLILWKHRNGRKCCPECRCHEHM
ncbi:MAG: hypothetical protein ACK5JT_03160, partial [Hyphomicrobiaceae bacterium]